MKPIISVEGLGKSYTIRHESHTRHKLLREEIFNIPKRLLHRNSQSQEEFWALKDVSFDVMPGDRVGIIGRNGAGKSTLLKLLSRITEPTTGRITLRGRVASLLEVGTGFHPELSGRENIFLNGAILGMSRAEVRKKFDEIVDFAGVEKFLDTPVKRYSSGMYVRLAFAVAAHLEPEILVVDEVLAVGDAEFQKKCLGKMEDVGRSGRTVLFVSHNIAAIQSLCTSAALIKDGILATKGTTNMVMNQYIQGLSKKPDSNTLGVFDLSERINSYQVSGKPIITQIRTVGADEGTTNIFQMGAPISIEIGLEGFSEYPAAHVGVGFFTSEGVRVASYATWFEKNPFPYNRMNKETAKLTIPAIPFTPGDISISATVSTHTAGVIHDQVSLAASFEIVPSDIYGSGIQPERAYGLVFINANMQVVPI